mmetsp:Transcript_73773/g.146258  ORF Transcript_73773/g.146258 Transcript_73773/m.146258 type:complete len:348 (+) Transcript_73773:52-1095(+)
MTKRLADDAATGAPGASKSAKKACHPLATRRFAAVVTEVDESGNVTMRSTASYIRYLHEQQNCTAAFICGTSGEGVSMTSEERKVVTLGWIAARAQVGLSSDTFAIVVVVGSESIKTSREQAALCEQAGVDGISIMAPIFNKPKNAVEVVDFLAEVAAAAPQTPLLYYHIPDRTGCSVPAHSVVQEAWSSPSRLPTFVGLKFSSLDMMDYGFLCNMDTEQKLALLAGHEAIILSVINFHAQRDALGFVGVTASVLGHVLHRINDLAGLHNKEAVSQADMQTACKLHALVLTFMKRGSEFGWAQTIKHCLVLAGVLQSDRMLAPLKQLTDEQRSIIATEIFPMTKKGV